MASEDGRLCGSIVMSSRAPSDEGGAVGGGAGGRRIGGRSRACGVCTLAKEDCRTTRPLKRSSTCRLIRSIQVVRLVPLIVDGSYDALLITSDQRGEVRQYRPETDLLGLFRSGQRPFELLDEAQVIRTTKQRIVPDRMSGETLLQKHRILQENRTKFTEQVEEGLTGHVVRILLIRWEIPETRRSSKVLRGSFFRLSTFVVPRTTPATVRSKATPIVPEIAEEEPELGGDNRGLERPGGNPDIARTNSRGMCDR